MDHINSTKVLTTLILLILTFFVKLFVGRLPSRDDVEKAILELPVNLVGAAISLTCAYFIASKEVTILQDVIPIILCYVTAMVIVLAILRLIESIKYSGIWYKIVGGFLLWLFNISTALYCLIRAVQLLIPNIII